MKPIDWNLPLTIVLIAVIPVVLLTHSAPLLACGYPYPDVIPQQSIPEILTSRSFFAFD